MDQLSEAGSRQRAWLVSTGRAAMTLGLTALQRAAGDPHRVEVIFPGYTCYSVPASVERAGLVPRLCDVDPVTLSPDLESLAGVDFSRVLAVVSANLYGMPNALDDLENLARTHGFFMLDDAAQALGARYHGRPAGGFGDIGLFSFDKGKNITTLQGGVLVADRGRVSDALDFATGGLQHASLAATFATLCKLPVYSLMLRPGLYGAVRRLPLGLGLTPFETDYPIESYSAALAGLATVQLERLTQINATRISNAERLRSSLAGVSGLVVPTGSARGGARLPALPGVRGAACSCRIHRRAGTGRHRRHGVLPAGAHRRARGGATVAERPTPDPWCPRRREPHRDVADPWLLAAGSSAEDRRHR